MDKQLYLFCGLPGSGKSAIAARFCQFTKATLIDLDDFKKTDVDPTRVKNEIDPPEVRWAYYEKGLLEAVRLFAAGSQIVVIDEVFHLAELRIRVSVFCREHGISITWVEIRCPYQIVERRLISNPRAGHILSTAEALAMFQLFNAIFEPFTEGDWVHVLIHNIHQNKIDAAVFSIFEGMS